MIERSELRGSENPTEVFRQKILAEIQDFNWRKAGEDQEVSLSELLILPGMKLEDTLSRIHEVQAVHKNGNIVVKREVRPFRVAWRPTEIWHKNTPVRVPRSK